MAPPVGIGVLGAANIAQKNVKAICEAVNCEVVAVGARDRGRAAALLEQWGLAGSAAAYGTYEEVLSDARVQAVYIPLPSMLHLGWVRAAAAAGKHVLLEKPVAATDDDLAGVLAACSEAGVQLMDGTMWMHCARTPLMRDALGELGELRDVSSAFCFHGGPEFLAGDVRCNPDLDPLGCLGDLGWYCVRAMLWAYQWEAPTAVCAHAGATFSERDVPLHIGATLVWPGGRRGHFDCGFDRALVQTLDIGGTQGGLQLHDLVIPRSSARCSYTLISNNSLSQYNLHDTTARDEVVVETPKPQEVCMWETFSALVQRCQAGGAPDPFWPNIAALTQRVLFAVDRSARNGCCEVSLS